MVGHVSGVDGACQYKATNISTADTHRPATSTLRMACGMENPSNTGTACVTPSPESNTIPVVRPEEYLRSTPPQQSGDVVVNLGLTMTIQLGQRYTERAR